MSGSKKVAHKVTNKPWGCLTHFLDSVMDFKLVQNLFFGYKFG